MKHRNIDYGVSQDPTAGKWRHTIYSKIEAGPKVGSIAQYHSRDEPESACKTEIDHGLGGSRDAARS